MEKITNHLGEKNKIDGKKVLNLLLKRLSELKLKNSGFSIRAYAQYLKVDQSFLSKVLKGEKQFSADVTARLCARLGLSPQEIKLFFQAETREMSFIELADHEFNLLSNWIHFAILELIKTKDFKHEPKFIATRLQVHIVEVRDALERLEKFKFIERKNDKFILLRSNNTWSNSETTVEARRLLQKKIAEMSLHAIDHVDFEFRDHGSLTLAISKSRLPEFKKALIRIRKELGDTFQNNSNLDEVYQLSMSLFPLTKIKNEE